MFKKTLLLSFFISLAIIVNACGGAPTQPAAPAGNKPAAPAGNKPAAPATKTAPKPSKPPADKPKKEVPKEQKVPVPADWDTYWDEGKGYEFSVPSGTKTEWETHNGVDWFVGDTPAPSDVHIVVVAFKDKKASLEDLMKLAKDICTEAGDKDVTVGASKELSSDYALAEGSGTEQGGKKYKMKILAATDITDNYIVILWTDESKFDANKQIMDEIWGSFSMYSGGHSGQS